ncbi:MAG: response regulator transcription factor [Saprospiraceae bacterium]|nr:response regulator transcription factor [Saprospiraceae bacterium]MBP7699415.1 response regulator transcription factor [Saprospiraceae bacterium]
MSVNHIHRILLVEDEESIRDLVKLNLEMEGFEVVATDDGADALKIIDEQYFDLLILDIMLPKVDGLQIAEQVRLANNKVSIIILTAKDTASDRIAGLKRGADDYLVKPFNLEELLLRVQKLIKRNTVKLVNEFSDIYTFGNNTINFITFEASGINGKFMLTKKEAMLLKLLIERKNEVVSRQQILQSVWGYDVFPSTRTIDNFILSFRKYFEPDQREPQYFHSVWGIGYKFTP